MSVLAGFELMESSQKYAVGAHGGVDRRPELRVSGSATLFDVDNRGAVPKHPAGQLALRQRGRLAERGQPFTQRPALVSNLCRFTPHSWLAL